MPVHAPTHRLRPDAPVGIAAARCLRRRFAASSCQACSDACPNGALTMGSVGPTMAGDCLGCGRCQAACPTGALRVAGFAPDAPAPADTSISVACWKSPLRSRATEVAIGVPCLFGLGSAGLVRLRAATLPRPLRIIDHGWCGDCAAGRGANLATMLAEAAELLEATRLPEILQAQRVIVELPRATMPAAIPAAAGQRRLDRRAFFAGLLRETMVPAAIGAAACDAAEPIRLRAAAGTGDARAALVAALAQTARRFGGELPQRLFHRVSLGEACRDHGVCAANCPTGALTRRRDGARRALEFDSAACIGCGICRATCPEQAIDLACGSGFQRVTRLRTATLDTCPACGGEVDARGETGCAGDDGAGRLCPQCARSSALARSAYQTLFGTGA